MSDKARRQQGFALVESLLIIVIIALIVGVGYWVVTQRNKNNTTATSDSQTTTAKAPEGTTASIDQLTQADSQAEAAIDSKYAANEQTNSTSTNAALKNLGGAYNESSY